MPFPDHFRFDSYGPIPLLIRFSTDFCLWAPAESDSTISDTEGEEVAWCTKGGRGTRVIPDGALQGVQYIKTPDYIQIAGFIDQSKINIQTDDYGGELDPHGQDLVRAFASIRSISYLLIGFLIL